MLVGGVFAYNGLQRLFYISNTHLDNEVALRPYPFQIQTFETVRMRKLWSRLLKGFEKHLVGRR